MKKTNYDCICQMQTGIKMGADDYVKTFFLRSMN